MKGMLKRVVKVAYAELVWYNITSKFQYLHSYDEDGLGYDGDPSSLTIPYGYELRNIKGTMYLCKLYNVPFTYGLKQYSRPLFYIKDCRNSDINEAS